MEQKDGRLEREMKQRYTQQKRTSEQIKISSKKLMFPKNFFKKKH